MNIAFMSDPDVEERRRALPILLKKLFQSGHHVPLFVTRPRVPPKHLETLRTFHPSTSIMIVRQWDKSLKARMCDALLKSDVELLLVSAWGFLIDEDLLKIPRIGCVNVHPSLLPKYRGGKPIERVLFLNEKKTGVTFHLMDSGFDTGPIVDQKSLRIDSKDNASSLTIKILKLASEMLPSVISRLENDHVNTRKQCNYAPGSHESAYVKSWTWRESTIDWRKSSLAIHRIISYACPPFLAHCYIRSALFCFNESRVLDCPSSSRTQRVRIGSILQTRGSWVEVRTRDGSVLAKVSRIVGEDTAPYLTLRSLRRVREADRYFSPNYSPMNKILDRPFALTTARTAGIPKLTTKLRATVFLSYGSSKRATPTLIQATSRKSYRETRFSRDLFTLTELMLQSRGFPHFVSLVENHFGITGEEALRYAKRCHNMLSKLGVLE